MAIVIIFTVAFAYAGLPYLLGLVEFSLNQESVAVAAEMPEAVTVLIILIGGGV